MKIQRLCAVVFAVTLFTAAGAVNQGLALPRPPIPLPPPPGVVVPIPLPPPIVIPTPPQLVVVPGTNVYVAPDIEGDIVFQQGFWWRLYDGHWYRSRSYGGPWKHMVHERVPPAIIGLPPGFRGTYHDQPRIHHREVEKNWQRWEHDHR